MLTCLKEAFPNVEFASGEIDKFFKAISLMNPGGSLYAEREKKAYETIHFSIHVVKSINRLSRKREIALLDCGCGRSYLSFLVNHVLKKMDRRVTYIGVDNNAQLVERSMMVRDELGYGEMHFIKSNIIDFNPERNVDIVCALHACDTATDEAIAKGVELGARYVIVAPCCQRQVIRQLGMASKKIWQLKPLLDEKVAREYVGVVLTESLRKLALESFGYEVEMFEFTPARYTPKNIMLRAEKKGSWNEKGYEDYKALRNYFGVKPKIEEYLAQLT
ncbi:MAG: SAM-dependent methyltransferase [Candidatus Brockarchaeota archaeon]|nr:SAM-dependent methyltransferase [Candidatus Brockarchaeota archaeon]